MTIEHKRPTTATAQYLYAHAFCCGFEGCPRPLYRIDEGTGARTLNSRICHIKARREKGPRFDPSQTEKDNRSAENLILMCVEHASAIDDPKNLAAYNIEKLQILREHQLQDFDKIRQNWVLDGPMADEVLEASEQSFALSIANSTLELGGKGGAAPGAGGGGGAAIGPNACGGDGGAGGQHRVEDGKYAVPFSEWPQTLRPTDPTDIGNFGAGGGGGSAVGEDARGGDGGGRVQGRSFN
jgi:hypothetical protein